MAKGLNQKFLLNPHGFLANTAINTKPLEVGIDTPMAAQTILREGGQADFDFQPINARSASLHWSPGKRRGTRLAAHYLPQGAYQDLEATPAVYRTLFTAELTGCSVYVHRMPDNSLRVFHVHMDHVDEQYTSEYRGHGGPVGSLEANDYIAPGTINRVKGVAVMFFDTAAGNWNLNFQKIEAAINVIDAPMAVWGGGGAPV